MVVSYDDPKLSRALNLLERLNLKVEFLYKKYHRARKTENREKLLSRYCLHTAAQNRAWHLAFRLRYPTKTGIRTSIDRRIASESYLKNEETRITKGKIAFETKHKYSMHFSQCSLGADYGTFCCDRCGVDFHHSPSTIKKAAQVVYNCACGYCTNEIIKEDWNDEPYF